MILYIIRFESFFGLLFFSSGLLGASSAGLVGLEGGEGSQVDLLLGFGLHQVGGGSD